jgi:hypothetical protein
MKEIHIILIAAAILIPAGYFGLKLQKRWNWNMTYRDYVQEMIDPLQDRIIILESKCCVLEGKLAKKE